MATIAALAGRGGLLLAFALVGGPAGAEPPRPDPSVYEGCTLARGESVRARWEPGRNADHHLLHLAWRHKITPPHDRWLAQPTQTYEVRGAEPQWERRLIFGGAHFQYAVAAEAVRGSERVLGGWTCFQMGP